MDYGKFWEINKQCLPLDGSIPRVPVSMYLGGDWLCEHIKADTIRFYNDYRYQQEVWEQGKILTKKELGYEMNNGVEFGVVMDSSIYGGEFMIEPNATPVLRPVVNELEDIEPLVKRMQSADLLNCGIVPRYLTWAEQLKKDYGITLRYGDSIKGCATAMGQLCSITNFLTWIMTDPDEMQVLIDCWYETSVRYIDLMRKTTGFESGETVRFSLASDVAGMLPPDVYQEHMKEAEGNLYTKYAGGVNDARFYHSDYHMMHILPHLKDIGVNEVNVDPYVELKDIFEIMPDAVAYGQIPPTTVLLYGTPEQVRECIKRDIEQAGHTKQLVIGTAGSINPGTPFENLRAVCDATEEFGYIY